MASSNERVLPMVIERTVQDLLVLLMGPYFFARSRGRNPLDAALDLNYLHRQGIGWGALRVAASRGQIVCEPDAFCRSPDAATSAVPRVALTEAGAVRAWQVLSARQKSEPGPRPPDVPPTPRRKPQWDKKKGVLSLDGVAILRVTRRSSFQWLVLDAFDQRHWPERIDNPLAPPKGYRLDRLFRAVRHLNHKQEPRRIHFSVEVDGETVRWDEVEPLREPANPRQGPGETPLP